MVTNSQVRGNELIYPRLAINHGLFRLSRLYHYLCQHEYQINLDYCCQIIILAMNNTQLFVRSWKKHNIRLACNSFTVFLVDIQSPLFNINFILYFRLTTIIIKCFTSNILHSITSYYLWNCFVSVSVIYLQSCIYNCYMYCCSVAIIFLAV